MASTINGTSTGNGGLIATGDDSGVLNIQTNETTAISIDASQSVDFTNNIDAPNTFGMKNRIINGQMTIDQRNAGASVTPTQTYLVDRWWGYQNVAAKFTAQQNAGSVTPPNGFQNYLGVTTAGSTYSPGSGDRFFLCQIIEGYNVADLGWGAAGAATVTLSFWVRSSLTGLFSGALQNSGGSRNYPYSFTINAANTWQYVSVTVPGDTSGTWLKTSGGGIYLSFSLASGSTWLQPAGAWTSTGCDGAVGQTNLLGTANSTFYVTGVQLEKGTQATSFDFRSYGTELALCQRYYFGDFNSSGGVCYGATNGVFLPRFPVPMRAAPTLSFKTGSTVDIDLFGTGVAARSISFSDAFTVLGCRISFTVSGATTGQPGHIASNPLQVSAEL